MSAGCCWTSFSCFAHKALALRHFGRAVGVGVLASLMLLATNSLQAQSGSLEVDAKLAVYKPVSGVSGTIKSVGSDTMNNLVTLWAEEFRKLYPGVKIEVDGKGSSNAIPALIAGTSSFGPMSRDAKASEIADFQKKYGYKPVLLPTSIDMLAVYVNRNNSLDSLSFAELDAIFSSTRKLGGKEQLKTWGQAGARDSTADQSIACYGRNTASGTYGYFKEKVLGDGDYGTWVSELPGSSAVVQAVGKNPLGIGYSGIGYRSADVKPLALVAKPGGEAVSAEAANAYSGKYPLARFLYIAVNHDPRKKLDPLRAEFVKFIFSKQGQTQVLKDGYLPLTSVMAQKSLAMLGL